MGGGPTPLALTRSPQKGWSPKKGTMVVGHYIKKKKNKQKKKKKKDHNKPETNYMELKASRTWLAIKTLPQL